jgi:hypothetical protein
MGHYEQPLASIVNNAKLHNLLTHATIPSASTIKQDISASFAKSHEKIGKLLKVSTKSPPFTCRD